jgi:hypothetical protein
MTIIHNYAILYFVSLSYFSISIDQWRLICVEFARYLIFVRVIILLYGLFILFGLEVVNKNFGLLYMLYANSLAL